MKLESLGSVLFGGGVLTLAGWLFYREWENKKLLDEFMDKVARAEDAYRNALDQEKYDEAQQILDFYDARMKEEEEVIKSRGIFDSLTDLLGKAGIVVGAVAGYYVLKWLIKRFPPPPPYVCPYGDGARFNTLEELQNHIRTQHPLEDAAIPDGESAYRNLPGWVQGLISAFSGVDDWLLAESWGNMPRWQLIAIAAAAAVITVICFWLGGGVAAALARIAAMAKPVPVPVPVVFRLTD
jgi:hypothetical protein